LLNSKYANYLPPHIQQRALEDFGSHLSFLAIDAQKYKLISNRQNSPQLAFDAPIPPSSAIFQITF